MCYHTSEWSFARRNLFWGTLVPAGLCGSFYIRKLFIQLFHEYLRKEKCLIANISIYMGDRKYSEVNKRSIRCAV